MAGLVAVTGLPSAVASVALMAFAQVPGLTAVKVKRAAAGAPVWTVQVALAGSPLATRTA